MKIHNFLLLCGGIIVSEILFGTDKSFAISYPVKRAASFERNTDGSSWSLQMNRPRQVLYAVNPEKTKLFLIDLRTNQCKSMVDLLKFSENNLQASEISNKKECKCIFEQIIVGADYIVLRNNQNDVFSFKLDETGCFDINAPYSSFKAAVEPGRRPSFQYFNGDFYIDTDVRQNKAFIYLKSFNENALISKIDAGFNLPVGCLKGRYMVFVSPDFLIPPYSKVCLRFYDIQEKAWSKDFSTSGQGSGEEPGTSSILTNKNKVYLIYKINQSETFTNNQIGDIYRSSSDFTVLDAIDPEKGQSRLISLQKVLEIKNVFEGFLYYTERGYSDRIWRTPLNSSSEAKADLPFCFNFENSKNAYWKSNANIKRLFFSKTHGLVQTEEELFAFPLMPNKKRVIQMVYGRTYLDYFLSLKNHLSDEDRKRIKEIWKKDYSANSSAPLDLKSVKSASESALAFQDSHRKTQLKDLPIELQKMIWQYLEDPKEILLLAQTEKRSYNLLSQEPFLLFIIDDLIKLANSAIQFELPEQPAEEDKSGANLALNSEFYACLERLLKKRSPLADEVCQFLLTDKDPHTEAKDIIEYNS